MMSAPAGYLYADGLPMRQARPKVAPEVDLQPTRDTFGLGQAEKSYTCRAISADPINSGPDPGEGFRQDLTPIGRSQVVRERS